MPGPTDDVAGDLTSDRRTRALVHRVEHAAVAALENAALQAARPTDPEPRLLVALSGGPDSSAVLLALHDRAAQHGWQLEAAHFDHGIAPDDVRASFRAAAAGLARDRKITIHTAAADVPAIAARQKLSLETAGRNARYEFLARVARAIRADAVITGHTMDDQAESILLHLIRGSGLDGLVGMRSPAPLPVAGSPPQPPAAVPAAGTGTVAATDALSLPGVARTDPPLIRPLLGLRRADTLALCAAYRVAYVDDPANDDTAYARSRIRHDVIPLLERLNPNVVDALARLAASVAPDQAWLDALTADAVARLLSAPGGSPRAGADAGPPFVMSRAALSAQPRALQARVLRWLVQAAGGDVPTHDRTEALIRLLQRGGHRVECGADIVARASADQLTIGKC